MQFEEPSATVGNTGLVAFDPISRAQQYIWLHHPIISVLYDLQHWHWRSSKR